MLSADKPHPNAASSPFTKGANILAIASGKDGVGKTWFSITLAQSKVHFDDGNFDIIAGRSGSGSLAHPSDPKVIESIQNHSPILSRYLSSRVATDLEAIADKRV